MAEKKKKAKIEKKGTAASSKAPFHIVCIGASAGGLEAIESFFTNMPSDSGLGFVVIQHLSPDYKSLMVELLSKRTQMEVKRAEEGMKVEANTVYLIPPKKNLKIFHGNLLLTEQDHSRGLNLPIDVFMRSLADDQGEKAIGIILSGTGSDGMRGCRTIKETGGMVMVQDEKTAKFDGMPRSTISTGLADFILHPEEMPKELLSFIKHPYVSLKKKPEAMISEEDKLNRIFALIRDKHKIDFTYYKMSTVVRRLERRMSVNQINELAEYVEFLEANRRELTTLYRELLIGVTSFFRDKEAFEILSEKWLPDILEKNEHQELRLWVAGCSTGEEAYSLAIICNEAAQKLNRTIDIKIFATDVDDKAIIQAGAGIYPLSIAADIPPHLLQKYFTKTEDNFRVSRSIREMIVFAQHNILKDPPFTNISFISCRNLLIYLQPVLQRKILELFNFSLTPRGVLFLGSSESIGELIDYFEPLHHKWKIYRSKGRIKHPEEVPEFSGVNVKLRKTHNISSRPRIHRGYEEERLLDRFLQSVSNQFLPLSIVVNEHFEINYVLGDTGRYFRIPAGKMQNDITKLAVKEIAIPLSTGLQKVFNKKEEIKYTNVRIRTNESAHTINILLKPIIEKSGQEPAAAIFIEEVKPVNNNESESETLSYDIDKEAEQHINDLEQELQFTRENLQATIEELETSNEELQATNEELLASNEELQSTNEELQSVNEELHTVNAEYQAKITELTELNNDMDNLLTSTSIGILFLDENLEIRKFTEPVTKVLKIMDKDIGRTFSDIDNRFRKEDLTVLVNRVQDTLQVLEREMETEKGDWYFVRILPYQIGPNTYSGIVLNFIDITFYKAVQRELYISEEWLRTTANLAKVGGWEIDLKTSKTHWTDGVYKIYEVNTDFDHDVEQGIRFYHPEDQGKIENAVSEAIKNGKSFDIECRFITAKKNKRWVRVIGRAEKQNDKVRRVYGAIQDISEMKTTQKQLENSETRYYELYDTMTSGVVVYEAAGRGGDFKVKDINRAGEKILKLKNEEVVGKSVTTLFPNIKEMGLFDVFQKVWKTGNPGHLSTRQYSDDRLEVWVENFVYKLPGGEIVAVFDDVSEKKTNKYKNTKKQQ